MEGEAKEVGERRNTESGKSAESLGGIAKKGNQREEKGGENERKKKGERQGG